MTDAIRKVASGGLFITPAVAEALALGLQSAEVELPHKRLTDREFEIFLMLASGESVTGIAERLSLSVKTASTHKTHILDKMKLGSIAELVRYALEHGLLDSQPSSQAGSRPFPPQQDLPRSAARYGVWRPDSSSTGSGSLPAIPS